MKITVTIDDQEHSISTPVEYPGTREFMYTIEKLIQVLEYPDDEVEDYILEWAEEIKTNRDEKV
jgi:hypothetical protein